MSLEAYLKALKKGGTTYNWDVVVTYEETKINELLEKRYNEPNTGMVTKVTPSFSSIDRDDVKFTQYYEFDLGAPLIQFHKTPLKPTCSLKMQIRSGKFWSVDEDGTVRPTKELPANGYSISVTNVSLGTMSGITEDTKIKHGNDIVEFPADGVHDEQIVLDFPTSREQLFFQIGYPKDTKEEDIPFAMREINLLLALKDYFLLPGSVKAIHYALAGVNTTPPPSGVIDLIPKSFRFVTYDTSPLPDSSPSSDPQPASTSYLSILIQTRGTTVEGNTKDLQAHWSTTWSDANVGPVPSGQSASIVINNAFFLTAFLKPGLSAHNVTYVSEPTTEDDGGFAAKCTWPKMTHPPFDLSIPESSVGSYDHNHPNFIELHVPSLEYDPNSTKGGVPLRITFGQKNGLDKPATVALEWKYSYHDKWAGTAAYKYVGRGGAPAVTTHRVKGGYTATYSLSKCLDITTLEQDQVTLKIGISKADWEISLEPDEAGDIWNWFASAFGGEEQIGVTPEWVKNAASYIEITLDFGALRFFSLTNILLPGRKVIDVDVLRIPRDIVIVGNMVKSLGAANTN